MDKSIYKRVKIVDIISLTPSCKSFVLDAAGWQPKYKAGQFLTLVFFTKHGEKRRSYSISSSPKNSEPLTITIKRLDNGEFSRLLLSKAKIGDELFTSGISGFFSLPENHSFQNLVFFAAGSGITPCYSIIKDVLSVRSYVRIFLVYSTRSVVETIFYNEIESLRKLHPLLTVHYLFSNDAHYPSRRLNNGLVEVLLQNFIGNDLRSTAVFVCGPRAYMLVATIAAQVYGFAKDQIFKEEFFPPKRRKLPRPPDEDEHTVIIHVNKKTYSLKVQFPTTILQAAKAAGIALPYSCEAGVCGSCVATCTNGQVWMAYNEVLTESEITQRKVLVCEAFPVFGDAEITFNLP